MKLKNILIPALATVLTVGVPSSCEDLLNVDSKVVLYEEQNTLDYATDTVYSVMGIVSRIQKIADRSVILNEIRGDLVSVTESASQSLRDLYNWDFENLASKNVYDNPADYYAVINNCNYFLAHADTSYVRNHKNVFLKEYIAVLSYRAWTYLQLAQAYGKVYFVNEPVTSADQAGSGYPMLDIKQLAVALIDDFEERFLDYDIPMYGSLGGETTGEGTSSATHESAQLFIPVRVILGDLYLWAGDYVNAANMYQEYLTKSDAKHPTSTASVLWFDPDFTFLADDTYASTFGTNMSPITYIPMEADEYNGVTSDLPNVFNSTKDNDYWYQLTSSKALTVLSSEQTYCYHYVNLRTDVALPYYMTDKSAQEQVLRRGDLRLQSILTTKSEKATAAGMNLSTSRQTLAKINAEKISIYRNDVIYLRLAEALNRCGLSQTAFAILKYGLCFGTINSLGFYDENAIDQNEMLKADAMGLGELYSNFSESFDKALWTVSKGEERTFDGLKFKTDYSYYSNPNVNNTIGIHSRGCGDAALDTTYQIPAGVDTVRFVEEKILDEMALETCFEGYRFGDILRISMHRAEDEDYACFGGFADNEFLAGKIAIRETGKSATKDTRLFDLLNGDGHSYNRNWFLQLVK